MQTGNQRSNGSSFSPGRSSLWAVHLANDQGIGNKESRDLQHDHGPLNSRKRQPHQLLRSLERLQGHLLASDPLLLWGGKLQRENRASPVAAQQSALLSSIKKTLFPKLSSWEDRTRSSPSRPCPCRQVGWGLGRLCIDGRSCRGGGVKREVCVLGGAP